MDKARLHAMAIPALFCVLLTLYLVPAMINGFPKGSDTYYHISIAKQTISSGSVVLFDPLNAGGSPNPYPPLFHLLLAACFLVTDPMAAATYIGPLLALLSAIAFYLFSTSVLGRETGLVATFIYGASLEIVNTAIFTAPVNLGLAFMFLSLCLSSRYLKNRRKRDLYLSTLLAFLLALTHALTFLVFLASFMFLHWKTLKKSFPPLLSVTAFAGWVLLAGGANTFLILGSFSPVTYLSMFQPVFLVLLIPGLLKSGKPVVAWFVTLFLWVLLFPLYPERVATYTIIPASMIAASGFIYLFEKPGRFTKYALLAFLLLSLTSFHDIGFTQTEITSSDVDAMDWIRENTPEDSVIASTWQISGAWIPVLAERPNVLGAFHEAVPDHESRQQSLERVFILNDNEQVISELNKYDAGYIFINNHEEAVLYPGAVQRLKSSFTEVYSNGYSHIFVV